MAFPVCLARGDELVDADVDHDSGNTGEHDSHDLGGHDLSFLEEKKDEPVGDQGPYGFGQAAQEGIDEGPGAAARGVEDWHRDADPFRDVVHGDSDRDGDADTRVLERRKKCGQPFGKVVDPDGHGGEKPHTEEFPMILFREVHGFVLLELIFPHRRGTAGFDGDGSVVKWRRHFFRKNGMRVFRFGHESVYKADQQHSAEKGCRVDPVAPVASEGVNKGIEPLVKNFDKRHVQHDPGGKTGGDGKKTVIRPFCEEGNGASDACGQAGEGSEPQGEKDW